MVYGTQHENTAMVDDIIDDICSIILGLDIDTVFVVEILFITKSSIDDGIFNSF